jgi:hypothetical protein
MGDDDGDHKHEGDLHVGEHIATYSTDTPMLKMSVAIHALHTAEDCEASPERRAGLKGPAKVNSHAYRENYDSIFGTARVRGQA